MGIEKYYENLKKLLKNHHQSHILLFFRTNLDEAQKQNLLAQIRRLDFAKIDVWIEKFIKNYIPEVIKSDFVPAMS